MAMTFRAMSTVARPGILTPRATHLQAIRDLRPLSSTTSSPGLPHQTCRPWSRLFKCEDPPRLKRWIASSAAAFDTAAPGDPTAADPDLGAVERFDVVRAVTNHMERTAVVSGSQSFTYGTILSAAHKLAQELSADSKLHGERIAVMAPPGVDFVVGTWATWLSNAISVPLALSHPPSELQYVVQDSGASVILAHADYIEKLQPIAEECGVKLVSLSSDSCSSEATESDMKAAAAGALAACEEASMSDGSLIIYTSGTTGRPKGVLHTRGSIGAQVASLSQAWEWSNDDRILHCLPLHHVHGLVNALICAHANGAAVDFIQFAPARVWEALKARDISIYMGVPTMYTLLLAQYGKMNEGDKASAAEAAKSLRLTISGSAACPLVVMEQWEAITGAKLLERYGMTEIGMALSNPFEGERRPGFVGLPLPGVEVIMVAPKEDDDGNNGSTDENGAEAIGELRVRAPQLFSKYWGRPEATSEAFDENGFFLTGDTVMLGGSPPYWKIVGRTSVDIIKSSGYKISALDIENKLLQHPNIRECAVLGVPDDVRGEIVGAVVAFQDPDTPLSLEDLATWCRDKMPPYHVPKQLHTMEAIPRNAMGKINKKDLLKQVSAP